MNEEKLNEVGKLTDVGTKDITKNKIGRKITLIYYYLIQLGLLFISGFVGYLFGLNGKYCAIYPHCGFDKNYIFGPILMVLAHGGNLGLSYGLRKTNKLTMKKGAKTKISPYYVYPVVFLNFVLSVLFFLSIYHLMVYDIFTATARYGVYTKKKSVFYNKWVKNNL
jgi:hypothetical protein